MAAFFVGGYNFGEYQLFELIAGVFVNCHWLKSVACELRLVAHHYLSY